MIAEHTSRRSEAIRIYPEGQPDAVVPLVEAVRDENGWRIDAEGFPSMFMGYEVTAQKMASLCLILAQGITEPPPYKFVTI